MKFFDTHFHWNGTSSKTTIVNESKAEGVEYLSCIGGDYASSVSACEFAEAFDNVIFTAGIHPHYVDEYSGDFSEFIPIFSHSKMRAIGEVGLDYFYDNSDRKNQIKVLETFFSFAIDSNKPLVIHCRDKEGCYDAYSEVYNVLNNFSKQKIKFVIHCYTGNCYWLEKFLEFGGYIGFTGIVTFPKALNVQELVSIVPNEKLLIETDSPYLAPIPHRGKVNHPKYLPLIANKVAALKKINIEELSSLLFVNSFNFYNIPLQ